MSNYVLYVGALLLVCAFYFVDLTNSERYIGNAVHKDYPGLCFYNDTQTPIKIGSTFRPTSECVEITCNENFMLQLTYCPFYMIRDGCNVTFNEGAEYPDCCAKIVCPPIQ